MSSQHAFDVFLSYSSQDSSAAREFQRALEAEGLSCRLADGPLATAVLDGAALVVACVGPAGSGPWEDRDRLALLARAVEQRQPIIPVLLPGAPEAPALPPLLNNRAWADLRPGLNGNDLTRFVWGIVGRRPLPSPEQRAANPARVDNSHIAKYAPRHLFGREAELERLDHALADPKTRIYTLIAWGGVGKTSLAAHWMARLAEDGWRGLERVYAWSFYSQGIKNHGAVSSTAFFSAAFAFFGDTDPATAKLAPGDQGVRLAQLLTEHRTLLVLDGLEPLQHPPGLLDGRLKDHAIEALLTTLAQAPGSGAGGLCLVTSREPVKELEGLYETTVIERRLEHLPEQAGAALLHNLGVDRAGAALITADDSELRRASREVGGHALTLCVLGLYLAKAHRGDARKRATVALAQADLRYKTNPADRDQPHGHAFKAMAAYEHWLAENGADGARQLALLRLLGLFDRPADPGCLAALLEPPAIPGLTEPLFMPQQKKTGGVLGLFKRPIPIAETDWNALIADLEAASLVQTTPYTPRTLTGYGEELARKRMEAAARRDYVALGAPQAFTRPAADHEAPVLDAHPLLREYFGRRLRDTHPDAWREGHERLYRHLIASTPYWPEGEAGLRPLYQAIHHGCQAGLYQSACDEVYINRIARQGEAYAVHTLGLFGADLGAIACFFDPPWTAPVPALAEDCRAWLLHQAAFRLRALGRPAEALEPVQAALEMRLKQEAWPNAARCAGHLSELTLILGKADEAVAHAGRAVSHAERGGDAFQRMDKRTILADALYQAGRRDEALDRFREAEALQAKRQPNAPRLYSMPGFRYDELLLAEVERQAWRLFLAPPDVSQPLLADERVEDLVNACLAVAERAAWALPIAASHNGRLAIALDRLVLGRAALHGALLMLKGGAPDYDGKNAAATLDEARAHLAAAVNGLRAAGTLDHLPRALLARAWLHGVEHAITPSPEPLALDAARADLDEAQRIAERGAMRLYLADIHLHRARLFHDRNALAKARRLIEECGYRRRWEELDDTETAARAW